MRFHSWCWADSGLAETNITLFTHLNGKFQLFATHELWSLNRNDPRFDPEFLEGGFQLLNQGFFNLSFCIHDPPNQSFTQSADALADHVSRVGDFNDQHTNRGGWTATLSAVRLEDLFQITQLGGWNQLGEGQLAGTSRQRHLHSIESLPSCHFSTLIDAGTAFDGQCGGQVGIAQIKMPAADLNVEAISQSALKVL